MNELDLSIDSIMEEVAEPEILFKRPELLDHPNIPKPLHGLAPRTLMPQKEWNEIRREAYARNNYHCHACGKYVAYNQVLKRFDNDEGTTLDAHESYTIDYSNKTVRLNEIVALCKYCHAYIHSGRTNSLYDSGLYDEEDCFMIFTHGDSVLIDSGILPNNVVDQNTYEKEWQDWKLIFNGKEYGSKFLDYSDWFNHYKLVEK